MANGKLRYFTSEGELVPTPEEAATKIQKEAQEAQNQALAAEQQLAGEREKVQILAARLRSLGVDPDSLR